MLVGWKSVLIPPDRLVIVVLAICLVLEISSHSSR